MEKTIKLKIVDNTGHSEKNLTVSEAVEEIGRQTDEHGKWLYVDGNHVSVATADKLGKERLAKTLSEAKSDITLTDSLQGG